MATTASNTRMTDAEMADEITRLGFHLLAIERDRYNGRSRRVAVVRCPRCAGRRSLLLGNARAAKTKLCFRCAPAVDGGRRSRTDSEVRSEMEALGFNVAAVLRVHNGTQHVTVARVICGGCGGRRIVYPGNARRGVGLLCHPCAARARVGRAAEYRPSQCASCGLVYQPTYSTQSVCDQCIVVQHRQLGHDVIRVRHGDGKVWAEVRCSVCGRHKEVRTDDLRRERVHRPWRCMSCATRARWARWRGEAS